MSTVSTVMDAPPPAIRTGADLREARERLGWSLLDVAAGLRIRLPHLEALEEGRISPLPGNAYALAFLRTYATALGLDADEVIRRFKAEAAEVSRRTELSFPIPMPERGLPTGAVLLLGVVLAICAYTGWYRLSGEGRLPAETVTAIPERLAPLAEQAIPPAATSASPKATPSPGSTATATPPAAAVSPISAAAAPVANPAVETPVAPAVVTVATPLPAGEESRIVLRASADAWLFVKDRNGAVLLNRVLKPGDTWAVPPRGDLLLTTGNAGGTEILLDGVATASLGGGGAVRRDLMLDPQTIKDGKLAVAALQQPAASAQPAAPKPR